MKRFILVIAAGLTISVALPAAALTPVGEVDTYSTPPAPGMEYWQTFQIDDKDVSWTYFEQYLANSQGLPEEFSIFDVMKMTYGSPRNSEVRFNAEQVGDKVIPSWIAGETVYLPVVVGNSSEAAVNADALLVQYRFELERVQAEREVLRSEISDFATRLADVEAENLGISDVFGLDDELKSIRGEIPDLSPLQTSLATLEKAMQAIRSNNAEAIKAMQATVIAEVKASFKDRFATLQAAIDTEAATRATAITTVTIALATETDRRVATDLALGDRISALTADGGTIPLMQAEIDALTADNGPLATMRSDLNKLTEDGGRLAIVEGQYVALTKDGGTIPLMQARLDTVEDNYAGLTGESGRLTKLEAAFDELTGEEGSLAKLEDRVGGAETRLTGVEDFRWILAVGGLFILGVALVGYHFWSDRRSAVTRLRVKRLEDIELTDLEWHDGNADIATIEPGLENVAVWRVRQSGTTNWCYIKIGRESDTPAGEVFTDIPTIVGGDASADTVPVGRVGLDILLALKEKRIEPKPSAVAA